MSDFAISDLSFSNFPCLPPGRKLPHCQIGYSVLKLVTGFAIAAFIAWKLIVASAITIAATPLVRNIHQLTLMR
jgi:hypothetical protein